jgi:hypothetical protein
MRAAQLLQGWLCRVPHLNSSTVCSRQLHRPTLPAHAAGNVWRQLTDQSVPEPTWPGYSSSSSFRARIASGTLPLMLTLPASSPVCTVIKFFPLRQCGAVQPPGTCLALSAAALCIQCEPVGETLCARLCVLVQPRPSRDRRPPLLGTPLLVGLASD